MLRRPFEPVPAIDLTRTRDGSFQDVRPKHRPTVTTAVVGGAVAVFALQLLYPGLTDRIAIIAEAVRAGEWWRLITGALAHGGPLHIAANAYFGWSIGARVERSIGSFRLLVLTLASALGAGLAIVAGGQNAVGLSGVLYGWLASWLAFHLTSGFPALRLSGPQRRAFFQLLIANTLISLIPGISFLGHLGGFVAGFLVALPLGAGPRGRRIAGPEGQPPDRLR